MATPQFAWDCGAGSGQLTQLLAPHFDAVVATDISAHQLQHAPYFENVSYQVQSAEHTSFAEQSFDLITVAQAIIGLILMVFMQKCGGLYVLMVFWQSLAMV